MSLTPSVGGNGAVSSNTTATGNLAPAADAFYYHTDHQGSVRAITDEAGNVVNEYSYDAYGNAEVAVETVLQRFRYTARFFDAETNLYYYRARHYDAGTGRFNQEDPLHFGAGDLNVHRYVANNPVNFVDPTGMTVVGRASLSPIALALLSYLPPAILTVETYRRFNLNATGANYFEDIANPNLVRLADGRGTLGDVIGITFAGLAATIHQANNPESSSPPVVDAGARSASGGDNNNNKKDRCRGIRRELQEHIRKLTQYSAHPPSMDNKKFLHNRPKGNTRDRIINTRKNNLRNQIKNFRKQLADCLRGG